MDATVDGATRDADAELDGLSLDAAVERVDGRGGVDGDRDGRDADDADADDAAIEATLALAAEDGTVGWAALEEELATVAKVVATPETRLELAAAAVDDTREAAESVADEPLVARRLGALESRLATVREDVAALAPDLREVAARTGEPGELYGVAADLRSLRARANEQQAAADALIDEAETLERWLGSAEARREGFEDDLDALASTIDGVESTLARDGDSESADDPVDTAASYVIAGLLHTDLRAELDELREWSGDEDVDWDAAAERLDALAARHERLSGRVDDAAGEALADIEAEIEAAVGDPEAPIAWAEVRAVIDGYGGPD